MNSKTQAASLSILSNTVLIILKLIVGIFTNSVSILSEAIHSTMDLLAAIIAFFSVKISSKPADDNHQYGHGKIENVSGVIEALLIFIASIWIIFESVKKIINPHNMESLGLGFIVMFISATINFFVSRHLYKVAKKEDSIALEADALHLKVDVYTSLGVGIGLFLIYITKQTYLDPVLAIIIALFILKEAFGLLTNAFNPLLDSRLSDDEINYIKESLSEYQDVFCNFHDLKTRKAGNVRYIELHLIMPQDTILKDAHDICDKIEKSISNHLANSQTMIHVESCENSCSECTISHKS